MALIYAGGQWRNVPDTAQANAQAPRPAPVLNRASGSSPAAVAAMIANTPPATTPAPFGPQTWVPQRQPGTTTTTTDTAPGDGISEEEREYWRQRRLAEEAERAAAREGAKSFLRGILEQYGLGSLASEVDRLVGETTNELVIAERLRQTQQYKDRFKGLLTLQQKGITDVRNEAEYLELESDYRQVFRDNDLQSYLGEAGSTQERDRIASIVGDFSLSVNEVRDRVIDARRVVADTPQEVRDSLQRFYNIDPSLMVEFVLDPENTSETINRRANAAIVGGFGARAGLEFGAGVSERIGEFLGRGEDLLGATIEPTISQISEIQRGTQRLAEIEQGTLSAETSALAALNLEQEAAERVRTLQSRERARFGGRAGITTGSLSAGPSI